MNRKLVILAIAGLSVLNVVAQPLPLQQPGQRQALPQLHLAAQAAPLLPGGRMNSQQAHRPAVVFARGSEPRQAMHAIADADASLFEGRTVYGCMVNSNLWNNVSITQVPYGIYSFTMCSGEVPVSHITDLSYNFMSGAWGRDRHYGIIPLAVMGIINGARYITIDTRDWREVQNTLWDSSHGTYSLIASTMAYDPTSDRFYAFQYKEDLTGLNWVSINLETDQLEQLAQYRGTTSVVTLAATPAGQMYYIDAVGDLYTVNKQTCRSSLVGNTGVMPTAYNQSMVYDGKSATFLWAAQSTEGSVLYSVNPSTAETTRVMTFQNNEQFVSLYITDSEALPAAPAAVGRPRLTTTNGDLTATIAFTVPSKTYGGDALTGSVNLNLWVDGENLKGEPVDVGTSVSVPVTFDEGNHYIAITTDNDAGISPLRYIYQYVGYDTPKAVTDVTFTEGGGQNTVTWQAPSAGINGGYIDMANLTYELVRMPDSVTVATGLSATTLSEPTPQAMHSYSYRVVAVNSGHRSDYAESNRILCGRSFTVPYKQLFADPTTLSEYFTVVDRDGDGNTWRQGYTTEVRMDYFRQSDADDWLISPPIAMETGVKYRFTMEMKIFTRNYPEDFEVLVGTNRDDLSTFRLIKREEGFTDLASEFGDYTADFLIDENRDYYMALRYCSRKDGNGSLIMVRSFAVDAIGNSAAPAQPADFTVTPDADDQLKATITLTAPTLNLQDDPLSALTSIQLFRDGSNEALHVWEAPEPGQQLTFTDEQVPAVGLHTYTAVAYCAEGRGEPISQERFIGVYTAPYFADFQDRKLAELWTSEYTFTDDVNNWWGWRWTDNDNTYGRYLNLYYYLTTDTPTDIWLFTPKFRLDADAVYTVNFDANMQYSYYPDMTFGLYMGSEPQSGAMDVLLSDLPSTSYSLDTREVLLVNGDADVRRYLGFKAHGATQGDYFNANIDNFRLTYRTSARAPYRFKDFKAEADQQGELKTTLTFNAPSTDYRQQALDASKDLTVSIFRGKNATIPAQTLTVKPGQKVTWTDDQAQHGLNYYTVACDNEYGRGELEMDTLFVGIDVPSLVDNLTVRGSADNKDAVLSWDRPSAGASGGIVVKEGTTYNVYAYDVEADQLQLLAEGLTSTTYVVERPLQTAQELFYYAVSAVNSEGEGQALASGVVLGPLYTLPFSESFAGGAMSTQLWQAVPMVQGATSCGLTNPTGAGYNQCTGAQDDDGGCIFIYNGYQQENPAGAILVSPKIKLERVKGNEFHFWAYHFRESDSYSMAATVGVVISTDDSDFRVVRNGTFVLGESTEAGWKEHVVNLDAYMNSDYVSVGLMGVTSGYLDVIYLDNFSVTNAAASAVTTVTPSPAPAASRRYDLQGRELITTPGSRTVILENGRKVISNR